MITYDWIQHNKNRDWTKIEKERVKEYLSRKEKAVTELGDSWRETQLVTAFRIARRHGVDL